MSINSYLWLWCLLVISWGTVYAGGKTLAEKTPEFSTAGFFLDQSITNERQVMSMNIGWRFFKGDITGAEKPNFDDQNWQAVSLPHGLELLPMNASGCMNYQGVVWYRKHFTPPAKLAGKKLFLHFEAVMGKCKVFVNGKEVAQHFGGYLPFSVDLTGLLTLGKNNVIAVMADNSDDATYPPGKPQTNLDYTYFGGIYRDVFLIATNQIFITDANHENEIAGGGVFIASVNVSENAATVIIKTEIKNNSATPATINVEYIFGETIQTSAPQTIDAGKKIIFNEKINVTNPRLWSPNSPNLYDVKIAVKRDDKIVDGYRKRFGIRALEFKGELGFFLNGKPYGKPLIGGNRHHDFAVIGNAVPNSLHYRDAKKMKDAGMEVVRNAHCPQDSAFLDACDELGLFVINNNPGWQFWNKEDAIFAERVRDDIRQLVRRDRNHPCMWFWEPVLNETLFPKEEAKVWQAIVMQEFPYPYCYTANDFHAAGAEFFPILFPHPVARPAEMAGDKLHQLDEPKKDKAYFTREWGDCVDNWNSHNSPSRAYLGWGEAAQLVQANHYAKPDGYNVTSFNSIFSLPPQYMGGALWHTFDHQRGYHPDTFYGGIYDAFRQPKFSAMMFKSQSDPKDSAPFIFIAHEMTPFSSRDVTIFSNCDEVKFTAFYNEKNAPTYEYKRDKNLDAPQKGIRYPVIVFKNAYLFWSDKTAGSEAQAHVHFKAEGFIDGKLVATHIVKPARRATQLRLRLDNENIVLRADGSDMVTVIAELTDDEGNVKRLNDTTIFFTIAGVGRLIGGAEIAANPKPLVWGSAPILVQATRQAGEITVTAQMQFGGMQKPESATLTFNSVPAQLWQMFDVKTASEISKRDALTNSALMKKANSFNLSTEEREKIERELKEVEELQKKFGENY